MLSLILAALGGVAAWSALHFGVSSEHPVWNAFGGVLAFFVIMFVINLLLKKKLEQAFMKVQGHIVQSQETIMRKIQTIGMRATPKFQEEMEREQARGVREGREAEQEPAHERPSPFVAHERPCVLHVRRRRHFFFGGDSRNRVTEILE